MKWCLSAGQTTEYLKKADEIKIVWDNHQRFPDILSLIETNKNAKIVIYPNSINFTLSEKDYKWLQEQQILCKNNILFEVINDEQAKKCKELNIPFCFIYPACSFKQLKRMQNFGAQEIYIDDLLCHSLDTIQKYYQNLKIRVIANSCGQGTFPGVWEGIEGSWFRPEDLWEINQIHTAEFKLMPQLNRSEARKQEQILYKIYAEDHEWPGKVSDFVFDIQQKDILNRLLDKNFQAKRNNCKMKCMENNLCHHCQLYCNLAILERAKIIQKNLKELELL